MVSPGSGMPAFSSRSVNASAQYPYCTRAFRRKSRMCWVIRSAGVSSATHVLRDQKFNQRAIEIIRTLLIRQMPYSRKYNRLHIGEMPRQRFHRRHVDRRILVAPDQKRWDRGDLRQHTLQFPQIGTPGLYDTQAMLNESRKRQRGLISRQAIRRNLTVIAIQTGVQVSKQRWRLCDHLAK